MTTRRGSAQTGITLIELVVAVAIGALLLAGLGGIAGQASRSAADAREQVALETDARLAMQRMVAAVAGTSRLLVPLPDNAATTWSEAVREPGVLAVTLDPTLDRDLDGFADADNDKDNRVDEDLSADATNDGKSGLVGVDDDGDGLVDEDNVGDDDEDGVQADDPLDGIDNDGDGLTDEDVEADMNKDGKAGVLGVDDDADGTIDEGPAEDDDEDGRSDEDWLDAVVYRLAGSTLLERVPNLNAVDGNDWTERVLATNVSRFRIERIAPAASGQPVLVDITLALTGTGGRTLNLNTRVRVGGVP